jgi:hypothetical protein
MGRGLHVAGENLPVKLEQKKNSGIGLPEIAEKWYHQVVQSRGIPEGTPVAGKSTAKPGSWTQEMPNEYGS